MKILKTSNIINNPPPISNNPMREKINEVVKNYKQNETDFCKAAWRKELFMDKAITGLLVGTLLASYLMIRGYYKMSKHAINKGIAFISKKATIAKNFACKNFAKIMAKFKK